MSEKQQEISKSQVKNSYEQKYLEVKMPEELNNGVIENRRCQDLLFCLVFIAFIFGCIIIAALGFTEGDPNLVLFPYDEDGVQCGTKSNEKYKYLYFYNSVSNLKSVVNITDFVQGVCVSNCPDYYKPVLDCKPTKKNPLCTITPENFYFSESFLERFCIPKVNRTNLNTTSLPGTINVELNAENANKLINLSVINTDKLISWLSDLINTWEVIVGSVGIAFVICIVYLILVRFCAAIIAYLTILLLLCTLAGLGYLFQYRIDYYKDLNDENYVLAMKVLCGLFYSLAGIWLLVILFMCNKIRLSIALVEVTAKYLASNCSIFFIPFLFFFFVIGFYVYWVALSVFIYATGTIESTSGFIAIMKWSTTTRYAWWFHLFALLYVNAFINALSQFVIASCACIWYFDQGSPSPKGRLVSRSFYRAFRYHLGSLAFGSLIIAVIRFMIIILEYVKKQIDASGQKKHIGKLFNCLLSCCQCILACIAKIIEFINKHAYIQIAIKGSSFCTAAFEGFAVVFKNLGRWSILFLIGGIFSFFGKLFISAATGMTGYLLITKLDYFNNKLNSPVLPTFVMLMIGWIVGVISMNIYSMSGDALLHSFLVDEEINKNALKSHSHFKELQGFMESERD